MSQAIAAPTQPPPAITRRGELFSIDLLRGLAALAVLLIHGNGMAWRTSAHLWEGNASRFFATQSLPSIVSHLLFSFGFLGVSLFFVISGFCIHLPYADSKKPLELRSFTIRRFLRLYPLYLIIVLGCLTLFAIKDGFGRGGVTIPNTLGHLVFWHYLAPPPDPGMGITCVLWTITLEVHFYILYALTLPLLRRIGIGRSTVIALAIGIIYRIVWFHSDLSSLDLPRILGPGRFAPIRFGEWLLGAWIAEAYITGILRDLPRFIARPFFNPMLGFLIVIASICIVIVGRFERSTLDIPAAIGFAVLVTAYVRAEQISPHPLGISARFVRWVGTRSYSLYLCHYTVLASLIEVYARIRRVPDKNAWGGSPELLIATLVSMVISLGVADLLYRLVEAPSHRLARTLAGNKEAGASRVDAPAVNRSA